MIRHSISLVFRLLTASVILCLPLAMPYAQNSPTQMEDDIIIAASRAIVTGLLSIDQEEVPARGFPLIIQGNSNTFVIVTTMEGTFRVTVPPDNYTIRLANAPHPAIGFSINQLTWHDRWNSFGVWVKGQQRVDNSHDLDVVDVEFHGIDEVMPGKLQVSIEPQ